MLWLLLLYPIIAVSTIIFLRRSDDNIFEGNDMTTYLFCGFVGLFWPIILPLLACGKVASVINRHMGGEQ